VPESALAFTWCQVPVIYRLAEEPHPSLIVTCRDGGETSLDSVELPAADSASLFRRDGRLRQLTVTVGPDTLFAL
jgi:hypothetical protein